MIKRNHNCNHCSYNGNEEHECPNDKQVLKREDLTMNTYKGCRRITDTNCDCSYCKDDELKTSKEQDNEMLRATLPNRFSNFMYELEQEVKSNPSKMKVFTNDKDRIKQAIIEEVKNFCDMIDCTDEPPGLDYSVVRCGVEIKISASIIV